MMVSSTTSRPQTVCLSNPAVILPVGPRCRRVFVLAAGRRRNSQPGRLRYTVHGDPKRLVLHPGKIFKGCGSKA
jgi:hypothetical protein